MDVLISVIGIQLVWVLCEGFAAARYRSRRIEPVPVGQSAARYLLPHAIAIAAAVLAGVALFSSSSPVLFSKITLALILAGLGLFLRVSAIRTLGPAFRDSIDLAPGQTRVTTGLYRWMRHPAELGFLMVMGSFVVLVPTLISIVLLTVLVILCSVRIYLEERLFKD